MVLLVFVNLWVYNNIFCEKLIVLTMHSNVTIKNVSWPHFSWATHVLLLQCYFLHMCDAATKQNKLRLFYCSIYFILLHIKPPINTVKLSESSSIIYIRYYYRPTLRPFSRRTKWNFSCYSQGTSRKFLLHFTASTILIGYLEMLYVILAWLGDHPHRPPIEMYECPWVSSLRILHWWLFVGMF